MSFGWGNSSDDDDDDDDGGGHYFMCGSCGDPSRYDDSGTCGACGNVFCNLCVSIECDICKARERRGDPEFRSANICEACLAVPGCRSCGIEVTICKHCITDHLQNCSKKSRAQRVVSSATHEIAEDETKIRQVPAAIESKQMELRGLKAGLAAAQEKKSKAERDGKDEGPTKKKARSK